MKFGMEVMIKSENPFFDGLTGVVIDQRSENDRHKNDEIKKSYLVHFVKLDVIHSRWFPDSDVALLAPEPVKPLAKELAKKR